MSVGPPMSMFSMRSSSFAAAFAAAFSNSYRLTTTMSIGAIPFCSSDRMCSGLERIARMPPAMRGWMVFRRPSSISGKPVTSDTSFTATPASWMARAVPPVDMISTPSSCNPRAKFRSPDLLVTLSSALLIRAIPYNGNRDAPSYVDSGRRHWTRGCQRDHARGRRHRRADPVGAGRAERRHYYGDAGSAARERDRIAGADAGGAEGPGDDADRERIFERECGAAEGARPVCERAPGTLASGDQDALHGREDRHGDLPRERRGLVLRSGARGGEGRGDRAQGHHADRVAAHREI